MTRAELKLKETDEIPTLVVASLKTARSSRSAQIVYRKS